MSRAGGSTKNPVGQFLCIVWQLSKTGRQAIVNFTKSGRAAALPAQYVSPDLIRQKNQANNFFHFK